MKKTIIYLSILFLSSQVFAVAHTASGTALSNTAANNRNCEITKNPTILSQCAQRAEQQADIDERAAEKKKADLIATGVAAIGAGAAIWPHVKGRFGGSGAEETRGGRESNRVTTTTTTTTASQHTCAGGRTAEDLASSCRSGSHIKIDATTNCMCVGIHCFDIKIPEVSRVESALSGNSTLLEVSSSDNTLAFNPASQDQDIKFFEQKDGEETQAGVNIPPLAMRHLRAAMLGTASTTKNIQACNQAESQTVTTSQVTTTRRRAARAGHPRVSSTRAIDSLVGGPRTPTPANSKLTQRMNFAVQARNRYAPALDSDSVE